MFQNISALPKRRNPQLATAEGSEGRAPEGSALMCGHYSHPSFQLSTLHPLISKTVAGVHCFLTATQVPNKPKLPNQAKLFVAALAGKYRVIGETVVQGCRLVSSDIGVGPTCLSRKTSTDKGCKQRQANSTAG